MDQDLYRADAGPPPPLLPVRGGMRGRLQAFVECGLVHALLNNMKSSGDIRSLDSILPLPLPGPAPMSPLRCLWSWHIPLCGPGAGLWMSSPALVSVDPFVGFFAFDLHRLASLA